MNWFKLEKDYIDMVDPSGNSFIIYWAKLQVFGIPIIYSGLIFSDSKDQLTEKSRLWGMARPDFDGKLSFTQDAFAVKGTLMPNRDDSVSIELFKNLEGNGVVWNCHAPNLNASINYKGQLYQGLGYAETIVLDIQPYSLPIDELRWGRFVSEKNTLVWIRWEGPHPVNKVYHNGIIYEDGFYDENGMRFNDSKCVLSFKEPRVIRKGKLSGVLKRLPFLKVLFSKMMLDTEECKYKSEAVFKMEGLEDKAWTIYEIVKWKR